MGHRFEGEHEHCGCCGECHKWLLTEFCTRCRTSSKHLGLGDGPPWDRTYEAVHGEPCPFAPKVETG